MSAPNTPIVPGNAWRLSMSTAVLAGGDPISRDGQIHTGKGAAVARSPRHVDSSSSFGLEGPSQPRRTIDAPDWPPVIFFPTPPFFPRACAHASQPGAQSNADAMVYAFRNQVARDVTASGTK